MAEWRIRLKGDKSGLRYLSAQLSPPGLNVIEAEGAYYLKDVDFNSLTDANDVYQKAVELIALIKGVVKLRFGGFCAIEVDYVTFINDEGKPCNNYFLSASPGQYRMVGMPAELTVTKSNGTIDSSCNPSTDKRYIEIARKDERVNRALCFFGSSEPQRWGVLYKVYEVIKEDLGSEEKLIKTLGASGTEISLFRRTANSFPAIGDAARHGHKKCEPPKKPMFLAKAELLVNDLLNKWLQSKA